MPVDRSTHRRHIILSFGVSRIMDPGFEVWVEETYGEYVYTVDDPRHRPKGRPAYRETVIEIPKSRQSVRPKPSEHAVLEYILIDGLGTDRLVGETAASAVYQLFRLHFVEDDAGLSYLHQFARSLANDHASFRIGTYLGDVDRGARSIPHHDAILAIEKLAMDGSEDYEGFRELCERVTQQVPTNDSLREAIEAVMSSEEDDVKGRNVRQLVEAAATEIDYAIAFIISASRNPPFTSALLGLRAIQRLDTDPTFRSLVTGFAQGLIGQPKKDKRMLKFLKQQFGRQRL